MKKILAAAAAMMLIFGACSNAQSIQSSSEETQSISEPVLKEEEPEQEEPKWEWETAKPSEKGMSEEVFEELHSALSETQIKAMLTVRSGAIVDEYYAEGYDETSVVPFHSGSKSFTGALYGIALDEGLIESIDDPLSKYLPEAENTDKADITLRQLLTQTSGIDWYEWNGVSNWAEFQSAENWVSYILGRDMAANPGSIFNYSTGNTHLLSAALQNAAGMTEFEYGKEKLFEPMDMESVSWSTDPQGITDGGNGISMTLRDAAKFGLLFLQGGEWEGKQLVPADWVKESTSVQSSGAGDSTGEYGFQWWVRSFKGYDAYYAFGAWGQYIIVVPELELITVISSPEPGNSYVPRSYFIDYVMEAFV
jgi:CubicO group peptidase (beta-lactamase class C family)